MDDPSIRKSATASLQALVFEINLLGISFLLTQKMCQVPLGVRVLSCMQWDNVVRALGFGSPRDVRMVLSAAIAIRAPKVKSNAGRRSSTGQCHVVSCAHRGI